MSRYYSKKSVGPQAKFVANLDRLCLSHQWECLKCNGDAKVLRVEMKEGNGNSEGILKDEVVDEIVLPPPIIEDEAQ